MLTFNGIHKPLTNYDIYTFRLNEILIDKPIYLGLAVLVFSKLLEYETNYDNLRPRFGAKNIQLHHMDIDSFVLSVNTKDLIKHLKTLKIYLISAI